MPAPTTVPATNGPQTAIVIVPAIALAPNKEIMEFKILAVKDGQQETFYYNNSTNELFDSQRQYVVAPQQKNVPGKKYTEFSPDNPLRKSRLVTKIKIQLGLSCNYSCEYCSQRFVERPDETNSKDVDHFMSMIDQLEFSEKAGLKIEFWGGEPFVYWKTLRPLVEALKFKFAFWNNKPRYSVITNGSILTDEIIEWLLDNMTSMAISHDGPGQHVRGPDPFDDPEQKAKILRLYKTVRSGTRFLKAMSFNSMINKSNASRNTIRQWFIDVTGDYNITLGEGGFIDAYDEGGIGMSLLTKSDHFEYRKLAFKEIYECPQDENFGWQTIVSKLNQFVNDVVNQKNSDGLNQKCGMDDENTVAVDIRGNVITCQNVSAVSINENGESHLGGTVQDLESVELKAATHWSQRKECGGCPVLHLCQGSCMFASGEYWKHSCNNAYSDNIPLFASAFEKLTGHVPVYIDADHLPDSRKDIFGTVLGHKEEEIMYARGRTPFPVVVKTLVD